VKTFLDYLKRAKEKAVESWHLAVLAGFAAFEVLYAVVEFILHALRTWEKKGFFNAKMLEDF
jgi:hypothetical protein